MYLDYIYKSKRLTGLLIQVNFFFNVPSLLHSSTPLHIPFKPPPLSFKS